MARKDATIQALTTKTAELELEIDSLEQYGRRHNLRFAGIPETSNDDTDRKLMDLCNLTLKIDPPLQESDLAVSHRVGPRDPTRPRQIIARFTSIQARLRILRARKELRRINRADGNDGPLIFVNEDLTQRRGKLFGKARSLKRQNKIMDAWSFNGKIMVKDNQNRVTEIKKENDLSAYGGL